MMHKNILSLIGATPLVTINRVFSHPHITLAAKIEAQNIGGSIKDRVALAMIEAAEASGELVPGKIIIEATSGNTGIGLAMVCAVKGYPLLLIMPDSASEERKRIMRAYGAKLLLTPGRLGTDGAIEEAYGLARKEPERYVLLDQYNNPVCITAHYLGTGQEIIEQTKGEVTHVVICLGTTGTAMGVAQRMKESMPQVQVVAVEPYAGHKIQGLKNMQESYPPGIYDKHCLDQILHVEDDEAFACARQLAREEGILSGMSAGAALAGALQIARDLENKGQAGLVVFLCPDTGERYLSTTLFAPQISHGLGIQSVATGKREVLSPTSGGHGLFTPGPSLDALGDLDAWRRIVWLDVLSRALAERGDTSSLAIGLADMDDRALAAARKANILLSDFADQAVLRVQDYAQSLGITSEMQVALSSTSLPRALELTRKLLAKGQAYEKLRSVYFDVTRDKTYGCISRVDTTGLHVGHTVDLTDYTKENPADFTLFKRASLQDLKLGDVVETPWGKVRPSWFLQLAATALESLQSISVMVVGEGQRFPHLDNFGALWRCGAGVQPVAWATIQPVMASEPQGELLSLGEALQLAGSGAALRLWFLSTAQDKALVCSPKSLQMWSKNQHRLQDAYIATLYGQGSGSSDPQVEQAIYDLKTALNASLEKNLDLTHFWPRLFALTKMIHSRSKDWNQAEADLIRQQLLACDRVLGFLDHARLPVAMTQWSQEAQALVTQRELARKNKDFTLADTLRQELEAMGLRLEDHPLGVRLYQEK
ncbi:MAG: cysteine synthase [Desulfovibrionales bacterium]|nr:cysteine synthase [Desulfovibrionales bacterium]